MIVEFEFKMTVDSDPFLCTIKIEDSKSPQMKAICEETRKQLSHRIKERIDEVFS